MNSELFVHHKKSKIYSNVTQSLSIKYYKDSLFKFENIIFD